MAWPKKCVTLLSNGVEVEPLGSVKRFNAEAKCKVKISCSSIFLADNKRVDEIDLSDMLVVLYKIPLRLLKWYLTLFVYVLDVSVTN